MISLGSDTSAYARARMAAMASALSSSEQAPGCRAALAAGSPDASCSSCARPASDTCAAA